MFQVALVFTALLFTTVASFGVEATKTSFVNQTEDNYTIATFPLENGETISNLKIHYTTLGTPKKDSAGKITNAILLLHGTGQKGADLLAPSFSQPMFGAGRPFDAAKYFVILPDSIGHGQSSKPSDGAHMKFPKYAYTDAVTAQYRLVTEKLGISHLVLVGGTSMGAMHTWVWGERYPDMMDALLPIAAEPVAITGRNLLWRRAYIHMIESDPTWKNGNYKIQPRGLSNALSLFTIMVGSPARFGEKITDMASANKAAEMFDHVTNVDANDAIYAFDSSRDYNPEPKLESITAHLLAINSADDELNVASLGHTKNAMSHMKHGRYFLIPASDKTEGHMTLRDAAIYADEVTKLMAEIGR